jgi:hypothetical protein
VRWVKLKHALNKILELITEKFKSIWLILAVSFPENISSVGSDASVKWVRWLSSSEWRMLGYHNEKNDGSSKKINRFTVISLF